MSDIHHDPAVEAQLADGILDRDAGEDYNPASADEIARKRAEFDAANAALVSKRDTLETQIAPVLNTIAEQAAVEATHRDPNVPYEDVVNPPQMLAGQEIESPVPPALGDAASSAQHVSKKEIIDDPQAPVMPVQSHSLRKDG